MRQGLLAIAFLVVASLGAARADYVIIVANISQSNDKPDGMGMMGNVGQAGAMGAAGGVLGQKGGMAFGGVGAIGVGGATGAGGMANLGGQIGFGGGGAVTGNPGRQMGGGPVTPPDMGAMGGPAPVRALAVIETSNPPINPLRFRPYGENKNITPAYHKWGSSWLWDYNVELRILPGRDGKALPPVAERFRAEQKRISKGKLTTQQMIDLAEWALTHGLIAEFRKTMTDLAKEDKSHPAVIAFTKVEEGLKSKPTSKAHALKLQSTVFKTYKIKSTDSKGNELFYALLHKSRDDSHEVVSRADYLQENLVGFYYWNALQGKALPMPKEKLVAILAPPGEASDSFFKQHSLFDSVALTADSFYSPRQNVVVFSSRRLDKPYEGAAKNAESYWAYYNRDKILALNAPPVANRPEGELQIAQTYSVLLKAMEDDGERASVSHSGTRQLLVSAGLLPGNVDLPKWLQNGIGNFMQVPYGSPWRGFGAPNWSLYLGFRDLHKSKKIDSAEKLLRQVVTDKLFEEGTRKHPTVKARSTAWALTYFLAQRRLKELDAYYAELSRLPRDLELDADTLLDCFARAFGCVDSNNKRSEEKLNELAEAWMSYILDEVKLDPEAHPILEAIYKLQNELEAELKEAEKPKPVTPTPGITPMP